MALSLDQARLCARRVLGQCAQLSRSFSLPSDVETCAHDTCLTWCVECLASLNAPRIGRGGLFLPLLLVQLHMSMLLSPLVALQVWLDCDASRGEAVVSSQCRLRCDVRLQCDGVKTGLCALLLLRLLLASCSRPCVSSDAE